LPLWNPDRIIVWHALQTGIFAPGEIPNVKFSITRNTHKLNTTAARGCPQATGNSIRPNFAHRLAVPNSPVNGANGTTAIYQYGTNPFLMARSHQLDQ
jgi:hypothetical protein